jgi:hypothetical protein
LYVFTFILIFFGVFSYLYFSTGDSGYGNLAGQSASM